MGGSGGGGGGGGGKFNKNNSDHRKMTAAEIIGKFKRGSIWSEFPKQSSNTPFEEIQQEAKTGDDAAQTAVKLLTDNRFNK